MVKEAKDDFEAVRVLVDTLNSFDSADQERIIRWAREKLGLSATPSSSQPSPLPPKPALVAGYSAASETGSKSHTTNKDIKSFINEKDPKNDKQLAAAIAYYYAFEAPEAQRKNSINSKDLRDACRLANRHQPKNAGQTLINAAHSGFLDKAEETGAYKINAVGENLVAMALPDGAGGRRVLKRKTASSKKKGKKATAKRGK